MLQVAVLVAVCGCVYSRPQQASTYGIPSHFQQDTSFFNNRHLQDYPVRPLTHTLAVTHPPLTHTLALTHPYVRTPQSDGLELLPPLQHVVGTIYPAVDAGPGYRFPISQLLNHTPPPNLVH